MRESLFFPQHSKITHLITVLQAPHEVGVHRRCLASPLQRAHYTVEHARARDAGSEGGEGFGNRVGNDIGTDNHRVSKKEYFFDGLDPSSKFPPSGG